jgi:hypothetical protein
MLLPNVRFGVPLPPTRFSVLQMIETIPPLSPTLSSSFILMFVRVYGLERSQERQTSSGTNTTVRRFGRECTLPALI